MLGRPAGAILGFANRLLQLYRTQRPRVVLVGWDTLEGGDLPAQGLSGLSTSTPSSSSSLTVALDGIADGKRLAVYGPRSF